MSDVTPEQLAAAAEAAESEGRNARAQLERVAATNARVARALHVARGGEIVDASPFDMSGFLAMAAKHTGMTPEELEAAGRAEVEAIASESIRVDVNPRASARRRAAAAGAPEKHIRNVIDSDPEESQALQAVRGWLQEPAGGIFVLSGGVGTHKTGSAVWALGQVDGGEFIEADDVLDVKIHDRARFERIRRARVVVLDELGGAENLDANGQTLRTLNKLWNAWAYSCAWVFVTCNLELEVFKKLYQARIWDRMRECGRWRDIEGDSKRGKKTGGTR